MDAGVTRSLLLGVSAAAGCFLLISTMVLVGMRRIYIDKETKQPIEFEFPIIGKVKSQTPALFLIAAGVLLVLYPIGKAGTGHAVIDGEFSAQGSSVSVSVLALPQQFEASLDAAGKFTMTVPLVPDGNYRIKYEVDRQIVAEQAGTLVNNHITLTPVQYVPPPAVAVNAIKEVPDDVLKKVGIQ